MIIITIIISRNSINFLFLLFIIYLPCSFDGYNRYSVSYASQSRFACHGMRLLATIIML